MRSGFVGSRYWLAMVSLAAVLGLLVPLPAYAQQAVQGWRALCVSGNEVEILVGGDWYRGIVVGPNAYGEEECSVLNSSYAGHEMTFAMAPERMRAVQAPGVPAPRTGPAPEPGASPKGQQVWRALCVPGNDVEILVGSAWYKAIVIGPDESGDESCNVLNSSYAGNEMTFAMAPERMRAVQAPLQAGQDPTTPAAPAVTASLAEIGEAYRGNTPAARERYEGRTVTLTASLDSVGSDYIRLTDGPFGVAICNFDEGQRAQLASLQPASRITVQGDDSSWGWGTFDLKSCRILDQQAQAQLAPIPDRRRADRHPPLGRYVCRQYMTTIGWIDLSEGRYAVGGVEAGYAYDPGNGNISWEGGAYAGWPARYEFSPAGDGHAQDEDIIRMTDESGKLAIDCFLTAD